jgi:hypothetical protein
VLRGQPVVKDSGDRVRIDDPKTANQRQEDSRSSSKLPCLQPILCRYKAQAELWTIRKNFGEGISSCGGSEKAGGGVSINGQQIMVCSSKSQTDVLRCRMN